VRSNSTPIPLFRQPLVGVLALSLVSSDLEAGTVTLDLQAAEVDAASVVLPISLELTADANEGLVFFEIDVSGSSPELTANGADYSAFSFRPSAAVREGRREIVGFAAHEFGSTVTYDTLDAHLPVGNHLLGEIVVDLTGLSPAGGSEFTVSIRSADTAFGEEQPNRPSTFQFSDIDYARGEQPFLVGEARALFLRGDCNADGKVGLSEPVFHLNYLVRGKTGPDCLAACDSNSDSARDLSDAIFTASYLFLAGPPPPGAFPSCDEALYFAIDICT